MLTTSTLIILALSTAALIYYVKILNEVLATLTQRNSGILEELAQAQRAYSALAGILDPISPQSQAGGIFRRIDEVRQVAQVLQLHHPEMFAQEPRLFGWLEAVEKCLETLRDTALPPGFSSEHDSRRWFWEVSRRPSVGETARKLAALSLPQEKVSPM